MTDSPKTVGEVLKAASDYLAGKGVEHPSLACELLASRLLNCKRLELSPKFNAVLSDKQLAAMRRGIKRVAIGEPVQYIIGQTDFFEHTFKVDRRALIPRPETEVLVEQVLQCEPLWDRGGGLPNEEKKKTIIVDVGTGCGCIAISLAFKNPNALYVALDVSSEAIELARENAAALGVAKKIAFSNSELSDFVEPETIDAIVANLPYVPTTEYEKLPAHIREYEPRLALDGGPDGLSVIRLLVQDAGIALKPGGFLFLEIGEKQGEPVTTLLKNSGFKEIVIKKDLAGKDRVICGSLR